MYYMGLNSLQVMVQVSDIKLHLTHMQYNALLKLSSSVTRVFVVQPEVDDAAQDNQVMPTTSLGDRIHENVSPELDIRDAWTTLDLVISINAVKLHLYDAGARSPASLERHGIARFALNDSTLRYKSLSDGSMEAQLVLQSFTMSNIAPGNTRFREIIPAAQHDRSQFMILYSATSQPRAALAVVTVDSPQIIFSMNPVFALLDFFVNQVEPETSTRATTDQEHPSSQASTMDAQPTLDFRLDFHDVVVSVLENDQDPNTQAIRLRIHQVLVSQQVRINRYSIQTA
jgi:vacuolar protein sorting-associated protein 13A/C